MANFSEEKEFDTYKKLFSEISPEKVVVRLLDSGSDKPWPGLALVQEANPALGIRGIRLLLKERWLLERQLHALLRAIGKKQLSLLLPMVWSVSEIRQTSRHFFCALTQMGGFSFYNLIPWLSTIS